jgi:hypothetical protein
MAEPSSFGAHDGLGGGDDDLWGDVVLASNATADAAFFSAPRPNHEASKAAFEDDIWDGMDIDPEFMSEDEIAQHHAAASAPAAPVAAPQIEKGM